MSDGVARPRWRDALLLAVLAAIILAGLIHYGRAMGGDHGPGPSHGAAPSPTPTATPSDDDTAQLDSAQPTDPGSPSVPTGGTCWDGRQTTSLRMCGMPAGARGLEWVFPSFAADRASCHKADPDPDSYPVATSYVCFQRAKGQPVTVTYDEVKDATQTRRWLLERIGAAHRHAIPGAHGGRLEFTDDVNRPARVTVVYGRFPFAVSVYADSPEVARRAWHKLVRQRPTTTIRGVPAS